MAYLLAITALLALAAPLVHAMSWGVPLGLLSVRMVLRSMLGAGLVTLVAGLLVHGILGVTGLVVPAHVGAASATSGGLVSLAVVWVAVSRHRARRGALLLALRAREPAVQDDVLRVLRARLERSQRRTKPESHAVTTLLVIAPLTEAALWNEAERLLDAIDPKELPAHLAALRGQALSACRLELDDAEGAARALATIPTPIEDPAVRAWTRVTEALLLAVTGKGDEALEHLGDGVLDDPLLRSSQRVVRAHVYAARGEPGRAREELSDLVREVGRPGLERAMTPTGPASDLARRMALD